MERKVKQDSQEDIDLLEILKTIWKGRKLVIKFLVVFGLTGLFIAVFSAKEYTASTMLIPQTSGSKVGGNLGGLAAMAGINLGGSSDEGIPPALYPKIAKSIPFQRQLLETRLKFSKVEGEVTYKEYYRNHKEFNLFTSIKEYTIGLPGKIFSLFKEKSLRIIEVENDSIYRVSLEESELFRQLEQQLVIDNNNKEGFIQISFSMPEALPSAQMVKKAQVLLQNAITNFKIEKAQQELNFIQKRYNEVKEDFEKKRVILASFRDQNQGLITARSQSYLKRIESEYNLSFNLYSELAKKLETQKIRVKEDTPIFTVIKPTSVPVEKSKPKRFFIVTVWFFMGLIIGVLILFVKEILSSLKDRLKSVSFEKS
ncbi:Wzz/FepE/Etk N-terminal domain-containing protein [Tenacibaculum discolor]|uniref:Wzz/FepE/Etk N-terminal domain-containing protein n=1 Tax=Tenacibaculum discolor TaxID=361581 RepID=UPI003F7A63E7